MLLPFKTYVFELRNLCFWTSKPMLLQTSSYIKRLLLPYSKTNQLIFNSLHIICLLLKETAEMEDEL